MKTYLRILSIVWIAVMCHYAALAQVFKEPTINSTLDNIEIIKIDTEQVFDLL